MFILEGLRNEKNMEPSLEGILSLIQDEMKEKEKKEEFYERKFPEKETKAFYMIGFKSLSPVSLYVQQIYDRSTVSDVILHHEDMLHPLFLASNITNQQYRKLFGNGTENLYKNLNGSSFSDYYVSRKAMSRILEKCEDIELTVPEQMEQSRKKEVLNAFYDIVNTEGRRIAAIPKADRSKQEFGCEFFINFNSLLEMEHTSEEEIAAFLQELLQSYGVDIPFSFESVKETNGINGLVYVVESILFQADSIFKTDVKGKTMEELFEQRLPLTFEVPTNEKPLLGNQRSVEVEKEHEIPTASLFEMILLRLFTTNLSKQGDTDQSGYTFSLEEGNDSVTNLKKRVQIKSDQYGNLSIRKIDFVDIKEEAGLKKRIFEQYHVYFGKEIDEDKSWSVFQAKFFQCLDMFTTRYPKEKDIIREQWKNRKYKMLAKTLYDGMYRNITERLRACEDISNTEVKTWHLLDLLYVIDSLNPNVNFAKERKMISLLSYQKKLDELLEQDELSNEEGLFLVGKTAGFISRDSRNRSSLVKKFLRQKKVDDILDAINARFETGYDEIRYPGLMAKWTSKTAFLFANDPKRKLTPSEKFIYISGVLSESSPMKKTEEKNNDNGEK